MKRDQDVAASFKKNQKLDAGQIERGLGTARVGRCVLCFDEVDSTNDVAWDSARQDNADGLVILAESQRMGRGRLGRKWLSRPGENLLFSVLLLEGDAPISQEAITIAAGLSVAEGVEDATSLRAELKWPNDVQIGGAKLAGVLVERRTVESGSATVIGVGLNVATAPPVEAVDNPATCLTAHLEATPDRVEVVRAVLRRLDEWLTRVAGGQLAELHDAWVARCGMLHQRVRVLSGGQNYEGSIADVDPLAGLVLIDDYGVRVHLPAAETTILPRK